LLRNPNSLVKRLKQRDVCATVPAQAQAAPQVPAVYLPPFLAADRALSSALLHLLAARADRLAAFRDVA